jgi:hypothetical protein
MMWMSPEPLCICGQSDSSTGRFNYLICYTSMALTVGAYRQNVRNCYRIILFDLVTVPGGTATGPLPGVRSVPKYLHDHYLL